MELKNPPEITEGLKQFLDNRIFRLYRRRRGLLHGSGKLDARRHHWTIDMNGWFCFRASSGDQRRRPRFCQAGREDRDPDAVYYPFKDDRSLVVALNRHEQP